MLLTVMETVVIELLLERSTAHACLLPVDINNNTWITSDPNYLFLLGRMLDILVMLHHRVYGGRVEYAWYCVIYCLSAL